MNALMLTLAVRLSGGRIELLRVLLGAAAGALAAQAARGVPRVAGMMLWLPAAMLMMRIAKGKRSRMLRDALMLLCAAGLVGGMVLALWSATGSLFGAYALGTAAAAAIGVHAARTRETAQRAVRVRCTYHGHTAEFDAMIDSGNTLRDYLTHLPVIVMAEQNVRSALGLEQQPMRPIFAQTAGGRQRMELLAPEEIMLELDGIKAQVQAMIALSPQMSASVPALVPAALIDSCWNSDRGG